ncbi:hypothetical protein [Moraxella marmotae]
MAIAVLLLSNQRGSYGIIQLAVPIFTDDTNNKGDYDNRSGDGGIF